MGLILEKLAHWWKNRLKKIYIVRERLGDDVYRELYFKKKASGLRVIKYLIYRDCEPHYTRWCDVHGHDVDSVSWLEYLNTVYVPDGKYMFFIGKVSASVDAYAKLSYETVMKNEIARIKAEAKQRDTKNK